MTEFEAGIRRALAIYQAGVLGQQVPSLKQVHKRDIREIYTQGYLDAAAEMDTLQDILPMIPRFLSRYTLKDKSYPHGVLPSGGR